MALIGYDCVSTDEQTTDPLKALRELATPLRSCDVPGE
jgi:hypothetical protein